MKILHVIAGLSHTDGGPPRAVKGMARAVADLGHEVWIYATDFVAPGELAPPVDRGIAEGKARIRYFPVAWPRAWKRSPALGRALETMVPTCDLVVIHSLYLYHSWRTAHLCRRFSVPYIIRPHGTLDPYLWRRRRWLKRLFELWHQNRDLHDAAALHFTTEDERELARPYCAGASGFVAPLGIWPDEYPESGDAGSRGDLLYLGRLHPKKGIELLLHAFSEVAPDYPGLNLRIIGSGAPDYEKSLRMLAGRLGVSERTEFVGFVEGERKTRALVDAGLFVLPSYSENFGIAVVEAMAAALPVLISEHVNLAGDVRDVGAGFVCGADQADLALALRGALDQRDSWAEIGVRGRQLVEERFTWPAVGRLLVEIYSGLISSSVNK